MNDFDKLVNEYVDRIDANCEKYGDETASHYLIGCIETLSELCTCSMLAPKLQAIIKAYAIWQSRG